MWLPLADCHTWLLYSDLQRWLNHRIRVKILIFIPSNQLLCCFFLNKYKLVQIVCLAFLFTLKLVILPRHKRVTHAQMSVMMCVKVVSKWNSFSLVLCVPVLLFSTSWLPRLKEVKNKNKNWMKSQINQHNNIGCVIRNFQKTLTTGHFPWYGWL